MAVHVCNGTGILDEQKISVNFQTSKCLSLDINVHALTRKITQTSKCETRVDTKNNHLTVAQNKPNCPINMEYPVSLHVLASVCNVYPSV